MMMMTDLCSADCRGRGGRRVRCVMDGVHVCALSIADGVGCKSVVRVGKPDSKWKSDMSRGYHDKIFTIALLLLLLGYAQSGFTPFLSFA